MKIFEYGKKELDYLSKKDKTLGKAIDRIGIIEREIIIDPFEALISSVVGQQISKKADNTVLQRLYLLMGTLSPENIENTSINKIQECGMTTRKAEYIKGIASAAINYEVNFNGVRQRFV